MGLTADWPLDITVQTHLVERSCLSPSEDILAVGGKREDIPVYSLWDIRTREFEIFIHPCKAAKCMVCHVSFKLQGDRMELLTGCACGSLCRWNISSIPHSLLDKSQLIPTGNYRLWSDDGSKAVSLINEDFWPSLLSIFGTPPIHYNLFEGNPFRQCSFSEGKGEKILAIDSHGMLTVWECSSGRQLFRRSYKHPAHAYFSPDGTCIVCVDEDNELELISATNGTVIRRWDDLSLEYFSHIQFFPKGEKFILWGNKIYLIDGNISYETKIKCRPFYISPDGEKVSVVCDHGVDIFNHGLDEELAHWEVNVSGAYNYNYHLLWGHFVLISIARDSISFSAVEKRSFSLPSGVNDEETRGLMTKMVPFHPLSQNTELNLLPKSFLSPDNRYLLISHEDNSIDLWNTELNQQLSIHGYESVTLSGDIHVEFAPDCSSALLWDDNQLMILQIPECLIKLIQLPIDNLGVQSTACSTSMLLTATFFQDSKRLLIVDPSLNIVTFLIHKMSHHLVRRLHTPLKEIRQLVISPTEQTVAICSDMGLILDGIFQDGHKTPLLSRALYSVVFSRDGTRVYTLEATGSRWKLSYVDMTDYTVHILCIGKADFVFNSRSASLTTVPGRRCGSLRISWNDHIFSDYTTFFIDSFTGKRIILPCLHLIGPCIRYGKTWLMHLSIKWPSRRRYSNTEDHLAYIDQGRVFVIDFSSVINQM
jgi:WD40 repeat protein